MRRRTVRAAVAVAAVLVTAACTSSGGGGASTTPATSPGSTPATTNAVAPGSATPPSTPATSPAGPGPKVVHQTLTNFRVVDVTFVGTQAWALGSADCLSGKGTCDAIEYSADQGRTWRSAPAPKADIATSDNRCIGECVDHVRFATSRVGYAYGRTTFFTTTDGGTTWTKRPGSAVALESLDGNVIRVRTDTPGCPPGCTYYVETAAVGSTAWHRVTLPGRQPNGNAVSLVRSGSHAYLQAYANVVGGAENATSVLWSSADDGRSWTRRGEVCPQSGDEIDSQQISTAPDGTVAVLCRSRPRQTPTFVEVSTDGAAHFRTASRTALGSALPTALGAGSATLLLISSDETYRSTDGGAHFRRLSANAGSSPGQLDRVGFASPTVVHGVSTDGRRLWTSTDAGVTWTSHRF